MRYVRKSGGNDYFVARKRSTKARCLHRLRPPSMGETEQRLLRNKRLRGIHDHAARTNTAPRYTMNKLEILKIIAITMAIVSILFVLLTGEPQP